MKSYLPFFSDRRLMMSVAPWSEWNTRRILSFSSALATLSGAACQNSLLVGLRKLAHIHAWSRSGDIKL